jgi:mycofactocin precursor
MEPPLLRGISTTLGDMDRTTDSDVAEVTSVDDEQDLLVEELLVEEISIDGMCGVY